MTPKLHRHQLGFWFAGIFTQLTQKIKSKINNKNSKKEFEITAPYSYEEENTPSLIDFNPNNVLVPGIRLLNPDCKSEIIAIIKAAHNPNNFITHKDVKTFDPNMLEKRLKTCFMTHHGLKSDTDMYILHFLIVTFYYYCHRSVQKVLREIEERKKTGKNRINIQPKVLTGWRFMAASYRELCELVGFSEGDECNIEYCEDKINHVFESLKLSTGDMVMTYQIFMFARKQVWDPDPYPIAVYVHNKISNTSKEIAIRLGSPKAYRSSGVTTPMPLSTIKGDLW